MNDKDKLLRDASMKIVQWLGDVAEMNKLTFKEVKDILVQSKKMIEDAEIDLMEVSNGRLQSNEEFY